MLWNHSDFFFFIAAQFWKYTRQIRNTFLYKFHKDVYLHVIIQNVKQRGIFSIEKNYGAFNRGTYPHTFSKKHFTFKKKTLIFFQNFHNFFYLWSPIIFFYWKYAPFFHILNDDMYMMLSVCCFWIFNKKKRCVKSWVSFFNKNDFFPLTYAWIMNPIWFYKGS
jgi:hypothetical protein